MYELSLTIGTQLADREVNMFEKLQPAKLDPILGLSQLFQADPRSEKVDLGLVFTRMIMG